MRILNNVRLCVYDTNPKLGMQPRLRIQIAETIPQDYLLGLFNNGFKLDRPVYAGELWRIEYEAPEKDGTCAVTTADHMCENHSEHYFMELSDILVTNGITDNIDYPMEYIKFTSLIDRKDVDKSMFMATYKPEQ